MALFGPSFSLSLPFPLSFSRSFSLPRSTSVDDEALADAGKDDKGELVVGLSASADPDVPEIFSAGVPGEPLAEAGALEVDDPPRPLAVGIAGTRFLRLMTVFFIATGRGTPCNL